MAMQIPASTKIHVYNRFYLKQDFTPFLKDFYIKPVLTTIKKTQDINTVDQVHKSNIKHACY